MSSDKALLTIVLIALVATAVQGISCRQAFRRCRFKIKGSGLQTFDVTGPPDQAFTPDIVIKNPRRKIGVVNTNIEGEFILKNGQVVRFSKKIPPPTQPFSPSIFKAIFPSKGGMFSGIAHETFQKGQLQFAKGMCVRVFLTEWQVLDPVTNQVIRNVNNQKFRGRNCVVFRTRA